LFQRLVDLSHAVSPDAPTWEGAENAFTAEIVSSHERDGCYVRRVCLDEHASTHLDAPAHMSRTGWTVDRIPLERLVGPLVILDIAQTAAGNADCRLEPDDIAAWEKRHGSVPQGAIVIVRSRWETRWKSPPSYRNVGPDGSLHFPGYSLEAAKLLVAGRRAVGLGIDTLSVDYGPSREYEVHRFCAAQGVYHLENVANLDAVPEAGATAIVLPMKLENGSGAPVRILAMVRD
jgi:kynurenine formamidase